GPVAGVPVVLAAALLLQDAVRVGGGLAHVVVEVAAQAAEVAFDEGVVAGQAVVAGGGQEFGALFPVAVHDGVGGAAFLGQVAQGVGGVLLGDGDAGAAGEFPFPVGGDGLAGLGVLAGGEDGGAVAAYPVGVVQDGEGDGARAARQVELVGQVVAGEGGVAV